ncbi:MAG: biopolymer transporter ExbD [Planctomycetota bacterium]|nr:biopolymer transporter ExbD [Planctomycetota bacterium]MEC8735216.1 biopolymer transporter ExbD [Planctomycetota bacterium]MEC9158003.1 biopolymer transporter ExbD [Planctomycetota bacterium]MED5506956.1 biopolymer transporter ExbD [Planctomycetota bacterium]
MRFSRSRRHGGFLSLDMTPMIDIVFLLLIFFLWTMQLVQDSRTELELPREAGDQSARTEPAGLIVNLLADGTIVEGDEPISLDRLRILALSTSSTPGDERRPRPLIRADRNAPAERLNQIMNVLRQSGLSGIRLATSPNS